MPAAGWKSINVEDDVHEQLVFLAAELRRSVAWTANRILESAIQDCYGGHPLDDKSASFKRDVAAAHDLI
jgi:hypothetical protein